MLAPITTPGKHWYESRTIILAIIAILIQIVPLVVPAIGQFVTPAALTQVQTVSETIVAILVIINRVLPAMLTDPSDKTPDAPSIG